MGILVFFKKGYKFILLALLITSLVMAFINIVVNRDTKSPDVEIAYVTDGQLIPKKVEQNLKDLFLPLIVDATGEGEKHIRFTPLTGPRVDLEFTSEGTQIILMNLGTFNKVARLGAFENLDGYTLNYKLDVNMFPEVKIIAEDTNESHVYAIPVKEIPLLEKNGFPVDDYYLSIRKPGNSRKITTDRNVNAHLILKEMLSNR